MTSAARTGVEAKELLLLDALPGVGPATVRRLVRRFGSAEAALRARSRDFGAVAGRPAAQSRTDPALRRAVEEGLRHALRSGVTVVTWADTVYPPGLRHLADPPPVLFLRGNATLLRDPCVTVVGARRATERARDVAERLGAAIARAGGVVVSGLALGVDGAAHRGALRGGGATVAVLGTGPDVVYPRTHRRLVGRIVDRGLRVSEFLPGTPAAPHHFPRRNRILAALSSATVVVEAGARSGALITVDHALDLGREIWSVPGPIDRATSRGSNRLLADGARPLVSIDDFVTMTFGPAGADEAAPRPRPPAARAEAALQERLLAAIADESLAVDDLAERAEVPVETALALLTTLELFGEVERLPGMRFRRVA